MACGRAAIAAVAVLAGSLIACGPADVDPSSGTHAGPLSLEHVATFGCDACGGIEQIQTLYVAVSPEGMVLLVDRYEPMVRVFGLDGSPIAAFGVKGEGPDSVGSAGLPPKAVYAGPDGSILVHDGMPPRIKRFSVDGDLLSNAMLPMRVSGVTAIDVTRQRLWLVSHIVGTNYRVSRYDDLGGPVATPDLLLHDEEVFPLGDDGVGRNHYASMAATADGGFVIGDGYRYRIGIFDESGTRVGEFGRDIPRMRRSDEDMERLWEYHRRNPTIFGRPRPEPAPEFNHFENRSSFAFDGAGRLWVLTRRGYYRETSIFDVFDPDGEFLQELEADQVVGKVLNSYAIGAGHLAGIVLDELDNTTISIWRIVEG